MNKNDFDILDNSLTRRNLGWIVILPVAFLYAIGGTPEQKKSIARLRELAIEETNLKWQAVQQVDACYCCRDGGCQEGCRCWNLLPEEARR